MATATIRKLFAGQLENAGVAAGFTLTTGDAQNVMAAADVVLLASGTATLQAALLGRPMVAAYRIAPLTYAIMKTFRLLKVPYFTLPNLLTDEPLVPEYLQGAANPETLANAVSDLLQDADRRAAITTRFADLRTALALGADKRAAQAVLGLARGAG